jgi:hypothetical protein
MILCPPWAQKTGVYWYTLIDSHPFYQFPARLAQIDTRRQKVKSLPSSKSAQGFVDAAKARQNEPNPAADAARPSSVVIPAWRLYVQ